MGSEVGPSKKSVLMNWLVYYDVLPISTAWGTIKPTLVRISDKTPLEDPAPGLGVPFAFNKLADQYVPDYIHKGLESWSCGLWYVELDVAYPVFVKVQATPNGCWVCMRKSTASNDIKFYWISQLEMKIKYQVAVNGPTATYGHNMQGGWFADDDKILIKFAKGGVGVEDDVIKVAKGGGVTLHENVLKTEQRMPGQVTGTLTGQNATPLQSFEFAEAPDFNGYIAKKVRYDLDTYWLYQDIEITYFKHLNNPFRFYRIKMEQVNRRWEQYHYVNIYKAFTGHPGQTYQPPFGSFPEIPAIDPQPAFIEFVGQVAVQDWPAYFYQWDIQPYPQEFPVFDQPHYPNGSYLFISGSRGQGRYIPGDIGNGTQRPLDVQGTYYQNTYRTYPYTTSLWDCKFYIEFGTWDETGFHVVDKVKYAEYSGLSPNTLNLNLSVAGYVSPGNIQLFPSTESQLNWYSNPTISPTAPYTTTAGYSPLSPAVPTTVFLSDYLTSEGNPFTSNLALLATFSLGGSNTRITKQLADPPDVCHLGDLGYRYEGDQADPQYFNFVDATVTPWDDIFIGAGRSTVPCRAKLKVSDKIAGRKSTTVDFGEDLTYWVELGSQLGKSRRMFELYMQTGSEKLRKQFLARHGYKDDLPHNVFAHIPSIGLDEVSEDREFGNTADFEIPDPQGFPMAYRWDQFWPNCPGDTMKEE